MFPQEDCISTEADVYLVVYSVTDAASFTYAGELLPRLRRKGSRRQAVFIVASKQDLVRGRVICEDDGKALARDFDGKYIEISAMLAHKVDDVLVALSREICTSRKRHRHMHDTGCLPQGAFGSLRKFFRRETPHSKSEDSAL
ncbi:GTP-binding protein GEM [Lamellibrachia satsuma]|nr:GTP-binding protein GEM [Lamellibrachia satsuma]